MFFTDPRPLAIYYEHPDWFRPLFEELDRRGTPYVALDAEEHRYDPSEEDVPYSLLFNRMSPSAYLRGGPSGLFYTSQYLAHLQRLGVRVVNGLAAWTTEISKAYQITLLHGLGLPYPRATVVHARSQISAAAEGFCFPVVVKPNIGGSGAGIIRFDTREALAEAAPTIDLGVDHTAVVQEFIPLHSGRIIRVEVLDGAFLYAIRIYTDGSGFDLCPADVCQGIDGTELARPACPTDAPKNALQVEGYQPPRKIVREVEQIMATAGIEIGGVEYMIDERDGRLYYYDINALSNFVADGPQVVGFDPFVRLADWLEREAGLVPALHGEDR